MEKYCQVGNHPMDREDWICSCAVRHVTFCLEHSGNNPLPGGLLSCSEHVRWVDAKNEVKSRKVAEKINNRWRSSSN